MATLGFWGVEGDIQTKTVTNSMLSRVEKSKKSPTQQGGCWGLEKKEGNDSHRAQKTVSVRCEKAKGTVIQYGECRF